MPAFFIFINLFSRLKKISATLASYYQPDLRALALMRIVTALLIIADLLIRGGDLAAHYTDKGLWPAELVHTFSWQQGYWSFYNFSDNVSWVLSLFVIHFIAALFLLIGYQTRIACILVWLLTISLHNRNLFILQSGDDLLRLLLLWGCLLPWNQRYSLDSRKTKSGSQGINLSYMGYLLLIISVYLFTAALKTSAEWHQEGSAIYYALSLGQMRLPFTGDWLYGQPELMRWLTHLVLYIEWIIPLLILFPSKKGYLRLLAFLLIIIIHTGIGLSLYVGLFFLIGMASAIGLLPSFVMDGFEKIFKIKSNQTLNQKPENNLFKTIQNSICVSIIVICLVINFSNFKWFDYELRTEFTYPANALRLNQNWGMFSPSVLKMDGWFVYYGIDSLGRQWDLRQNTDFVNFTMPKHIVSLYKSDRWRKLAENMQDNRYTFLRPLYCKYVLKTWNAHHPEKQIATLNLYYMQKKSLPDYKTTDPEKVIFSVCIHD